MEPKSLASSVTGGSALVGGSVTIRSIVDDRNSRSVEEFKSDEKALITDVLKSRGLEFVGIRDTEILKETKS